MTPLHLTLGPEQLPIPPLTIYQLPEAFSQVRPWLKSAEPPPQGKAGAGWVMPSPPQAAETCRERSL